MERSNKLLILDLDETLMFASMSSLDRQPDFDLGVCYAWRRPGVETFLAKAFERCEVGVWTAATQDYATAALSHLWADLSDFTFIWAREHCSFVEHISRPEGILWRKDLSRLCSSGRNGGNIIVVDDSFQSWSGYEDNVVLVSKYSGDPEDRELEILLPFLKLLCAAPDVRAIDKVCWREMVNRTGDGKHSTT